ncbi:lysophospholipid acyltransferase family protein [Flavobacterium silvaticum]|uniref:1-acyl-sn-glycerol-3-phosphate acyltransferase n=1 Tax=Flavobacterium silvaticum TaxID=1852020 RepID=A0A972JGM3_9FLAO|nr:lysophospholipid acyltransferase family protein [Flavobacterium silvaticum]NMH28346.1 1-acyl-sn-glycerol-3-phosphate acyltransferase [Flavobacterium silvaticum]
MKYFRLAATVVWRIWFYVLMAIPIIGLLPFLLVAISREKWYPYFFVMARFWAKFILLGMGFYYKVQRDEEPEPGKSYMIVANHSSMADIMLMLVLIRNPFVFVGKMELAKIPLFGFVYKRTCILVDRSSPKSRRAVFERAQSRLSQGLSICIFPEGGVSDDESILLDKFKDGAFRLAIEHHIPIVPLSFPDNKKRFSFTFLTGSPGLMRARIHRFVSTQGLEDENKKDIHNLRNQVHEIIEKGLLEAQKKDAGQASF